MRHVIPLTYSDGRIKAYAIFDDSVENLAQFMNHRRNADQDFDALFPPNEKSLAQAYADTKYVTGF